LLVSYVAIYRCQEFANTSVHLSRPAGRRMSF
jgi:hypothetical protein